MIKLKNPVRIAAAAGSLVCAAIALAQTSAAPSNEAASSSTKEPTIDPISGLVAEGDYVLVRALCLGCHSSKLIVQNRADHDGWGRIIRWMQETQKLIDLGPMESNVLDYLAQHYGPATGQAGRRSPLELKESDWYRIE